jgi:hypothetical protein
VDFGEALAEIAGVERKVHFFAMDLPHSDACFVRAYPEETAEAFCDGHNAAFGFFGNVPRSILYDNTKLAVARIETTSTNPIATKSSNSVSAYSSMNGKAVGSTKSSAHGSGWKIPAFRSRLRSRKLPALPMQWSPVTVLTESAPGVRGKNTIRLAPVPRRMSA